MRPVIDLTGHRYGKLTVIKRNGSKKQGQGLHSAWDCQCDCGNYKTILSSNLRSGDTKSCGCAKLKPSRMDNLDISGHKFGKLTAIKKATRPSSWGRKAVAYLFRCDCGTEKILEAGIVRRGRTKSCGCSHIRAKGIAPLNNLFANYKSAARRRKIDFLLDKNDFAELITKNCFYCNKKPTMVAKSRIDSITYNGLDRIDSQLSYNKANCIACCKYCNRMKSDLTLEEFKHHISLIYENFKK